MIALALVFVSQTTGPDASTAARMSITGAVDQMSKRRAQVASCAAEIARRLSKTSQERAETVAEVAAFRCLKAAGLPAEGAEFEQARLTALDVALASREHP